MFTRASAFTISVAQFNSNSEKDQSTSDEIVDADAQSELLITNIMSNYDCDFQRAEESEKIFDAIDLVGTGIHTQRV